MAPPPLQSSLRLTLRLNMSSCRRHPRKARSQLGDFLIPTFARPIHHHRLHGFLTRAQIKEGAHLVRLNMIWMAAKQAEAVESFCPETL